MTLRLALGLLAACGGSATTAIEPTNSTTASGDAPRIDGSEARRRVEEGALLLDVSPPSRAAESVIQGRVHIPLGELETRLAELPRDRAIVVYCYGGGGSPRAGALLRREGFDVYVLGAMSNWSRE